MIVTVRCFYSAGRPKPKPKMGDRRTTKKHGEQVRVPVVVRHGPYRGAWVVRSGRQCYEWVSPEEAYKQWPHLRPAGVRVAAPSVPPSEKT